MKTLTTKVLVAVVLIFGVSNVAHAEDLNLTLELMRQYAYQAKKIDTSSAGSLQIPVNYAESDLELTADIMAQYASHTSRAIQDDTYLDEGYRGRLPSVERDRVTDNAANYWNTNKYQSNGRWYAKPHLSHFLRQVIHYGYSHSHHKDCHICNRIGKRFYRYTPADYRPDGTWYNSWTAHFVPPYFLCYRIQYRTYKYYDHSIGREVGGFAWTDGNHSTKHLRYSYDDERWYFNHPNGSRYPLDFDN